MMTRSTQGVLLTLMTLVSLALPAGAQETPSEAPLPEPDATTEPAGDETPGDELPAEDLPLDEPADGSGANPDPAADPFDGQLNNPFNSPFSQQSFVPDISLILDASVGGRTLANEDFSALRNPLNLRGPGGLEHLLNAGNGFNFNYAELTLGSTVDPFFDLLAIFHLAPTEFEIEEAYFNTRGLPLNLQLKAGKFLSHFGRLNQQHAHFWSFSDRPVVYSAFFGNEGLNEIGARLDWLAPTDFYLNFGLELLQGTNGNSFGTGGFAVGDQQVAGINLPNLVVATVKSSVDLLDNLVLLGGLSYAGGGARFAGEAEADAEVHQAEAEHAGLENFTGISQVAGADLSLRWFLDSYNDLTWQSEFLFRHVGGSRYEGTSVLAAAFYQSGLYSQLVWRFGQQWRTGLRLDLLTQNQHVEAGEAAAEPLGLPRWSAMLEFTPSDFSRFRLQYSLDQSQFLNGNNPVIHSVFLNVNLAMGAHGAHTF